MDRTDELYFKELMSDFNFTFNKEMSEDIKKMWYEVIEELVYYREPKQYDRTFQLRDKFKVEIKNGMLYAYVDTDGMEYYNLKGKVSGENVVHWIDVGHNAGESPFGDTDYFYNYPARHIIEEFANRVKLKYPQFNIEVYRDTPSII